MNIKSFLMVFAASLMLLACKSNTNENMSTLNLTQEWDKTFPKSELVNHSKVTFHNRYGIELAADMYVPKNAEGKLPAIAVSGPFGAVKEQCSGLYAQHMAERGFLTIAFDPSYTGESGGEPRRMASPDINTEDFLAAVDFLSTCDLVDPERIGIIGICGWGGMAINAAAQNSCCQPQTVPVPPHQRCCVVPRFVRQCLFANTVVPRINVGARSLLWAVPAQAPEAVCPTLLLPVFAGGREPEVSRPWSRQSQSALPHQTASGAKPPLPSVAPAPWSLADSLPAAAIPRSLLPSMRLPTTKALKLTYA